jgi:hypothetical protein
MKKLLLFGILVLALNSTSQITLIPDPNFEQALINLGHDTGSPDGSVPTANINSITTLYVNSANISDLTGIQDFTALTELFCFENHLTSLDLTHNIALWWLDCSNNVLTNIDITHNTALSYLFCEVNQLTNLDVTHNSSLIFLLCPFNQITSLDLTQNTELTSFTCYYNQLNCLNIKNSNNTNMSISTRFNPNLFCIEVDNVTWSTVNWTSSNLSIDIQTSFSANCGNPCTLGITELNINSPKQLSKIIDLTGREIQYKKNTLMIYVFEDGTSERIIEFE